MQVAFQRLRWSGTPPRSLNEEPIAHAQVVGHRATPIGPKRLDPAPSSAVSNPAPPHSGQQPRKHRSRPWHTNGRWTPTGSHSRGPVRREHHQSLRGNAERQPAGLDVHRPDGGHRRMGRGAGRLGSGGPKGITGECWDGGCRERWPEPAVGWTRWASLLWLRHRVLGSSSQLSPPPRRSALRWTSGSRVQQRLQGGGVRAAKCPSGGNSRFWLLSPALPADLGQSSSTGRRRRPDPQHGERGSGSVAAYHQRISTFE